MVTTTEELDERAERLNEKLQKLLLLFLLGQLTAAMTKALGDEYILEEYLSLVVYLRKQHESPKGFSVENQRIRKILDQIRQDFHAIIDREGLQTTEPALKNRVWLVALGFVYSIFNASIVEIAIIKGVKYLRYNTVKIPPWPCETCKENEGTYSIHESLPRIPVHNECRCFWTLVV